MDTTDFNDAPEQPQGSQAEYIRLVKGGLVPLRVVAPCLVWVLHDYFITIEDEVRYVWTQKRGFGKSLFFFIRYYTILLLVFDVVQIHSFAIKGVTNETLCTAMDSIIRVVGAVSLWAVEIYMQIRIYALYERSKKVAIFNGVFFIFSALAFIGICIWNAQRRSQIIAPAMIYPLPGCPTINGGFRWAQWLPATVFEINLFGFALYKAIRSSSLRTKLNNRIPLVSVLLQDNTLYFLGVTFVLIMNNLMTLEGSGIPWYGFSPFHAAVGIMTARMYIHLRKFAVKSMQEPELSMIKGGSPINFEAALGAIDDGDSDLGSYDGHSFVSDLTDHEPMVEMSVEGAGGDIESQRQLPITSSPIISPSNSMQWASSSSSSHHHAHPTPPELSSPPDVRISPGIELL